MGSEQSTVNASPKVGYHVLQVHSSSPGEACGLIAFFDFIVAAQDIAFDKEDSSFVNILKENIGKEVRLIVYNTKTESLRELNLIPNDSWGGSGIAGISIRFCSIESAMDHVWHILDVYPNSPASSAGLYSRTDYIVGTPEVQFTDSEDLFSYINANEGKTIAFYVYNTNLDSVRLVNITLNRLWGGSGSMGCDIAYGFLHRIPMSIGTIPINAKNLSTSLETRRQPLQESTQAFRSLPTDMNSMEKLVPQATNPDLESNSKPSSTKQQTHSTFGT